VDAIGKVETMTYEEWKELAPVRDLVRQVIDGTIYPGQKFPKSGSEWLADNVVNALKKEGWLAYPPKTDQPSKSTVESS
jgi:hypothetical protein